MTSLPVIPVPDTVTLAPGTFLLDAHTGIIAAGSARAEGEYLADILNKATGSVVALNVDSPKTSSRIELRIDTDCRNLGSEGYRLVVSPNDVMIAACEGAGLFYGIQTLLQLLPPGFYGGHAIEHGQCAIPCVEIEDRPRFSWRGAMLDVSRHFLPKEFVLKFIDLLALHKMNRLQLHLTDDQGWRLEIKKYPLLTEIGAVRAKTLVGRALINPSAENFNPESQVFDNQVHSGYYTQEDAREIVAYAARRHVTVVPEIEMPGHAQAAIAAYPFLGCSDRPLEVSPTWGIHDALYKPSERTFAFFRDVLAEVLDIFPSQYIHIGGDEAVKTQWKNSAECQALMRDLGLANEEALQSYFVGQIDDFLTGQGRTLVGWDEVLEGGLSPNAVVMSWRGEEGGVAAAREDHDVVMAPHFCTYFDYYQAEDRGAEPLAFNDVLTLPQVYGYEPIPPEMTPAAAQHVLGTQCQLWSEYMPTPEQVEYMAFPRLCALSEVAWSETRNKNFDSFSARLRTHLQRLDTLHVRYRHP